jgi:hypothetical protein
VLFCGKRIAIDFGKTLLNKEYENGKCIEMFGSVFWEFFGENPVVKLGKSGKAGGGGAL